NQLEQMVDGLHAHAGVQPARARRHRDCDPSADASVPETDPQRAVACRAHQGAPQGWRCQARRLVCVLERTGQAEGAGVPITLTRLASEIWDVSKQEDWVLTANTLQDWAYKLWDFDKPCRHPGQALGTGTQIGISLGVALAHRGAGRLVVDIQPD